MSSMEVGGTLRLDGRPSATQKAVEVLRGQDTACHSGSRCVRLVGKLRRDYQQV